MRGLSRRTSLRIAAAAVGTIAAPRIVSRQSLASDGKLSLLGWPEYLPPDLVESFSKQNGIDVQVDTTLDNDTYAKVRAMAAAGNAPDVAYVESRLASAIAQEGLLAPWEGVEKAENATLPSILLASDEVGGRIDGARLAFPMLWSTEGLGFKRAAVDQKDVSYQQLWDPKAERGITFRVSTALTSACLLLEAQRTIESIGLLYRDEQAAKSVLEPASEIVIAQKPRAKFWTDALQATSALEGDTVQLGQVSEYAAFQVVQKLGLANVGYVSPPEGAIGWIDSMVMLAGSARSEEARKWLEFNVEGKTAARVAENSAANSAAREALANLPADRQAFLKEAYPVVVADSGGANDPCPKLNQCRCEDRSCSENCCRNRVVAGSIYWPRVEPEWLVVLRTQYIDKIQAA